MSVEYDGGMDSRYLLLIIIFMEIGMIGYLAWRIEGKDKDEK